MSFRVMTPPPEQKLQMNSHSSPTFSSLGRSPSIGPPAYTTDDLLAAKYEKLSRWVQWFRTFIAIVTLGASIAVIACAAASLQAFSGSHLEPQWLLPLWPLNVDLRPTHTVLGCGITIAVFSFAYLAASFISMPRKLHYLNISSTVISFLGLFASLFTIIFASIITNRLASSTSSGSLNSWTCRWQGFEKVAPANFTKICNDGTAALDLVILLVIVEVLAVGATAWGWWVEMRLKRSGVGAGKSEVELV
ncbi:hypothetical protein MMC28_006498 [Mycoblastus sanguinarius]|nr:hypothetical protein [Mycoblastus sanguinarius]